MEDQLDLQEKAELDELMDTIKHFSSVQKSVDTFIVMARQEEVFSQMSEEERDLIVGIIGIIVGSLTAEILKIHGHLQSIIDAVANLQEQVEDKPRIYLDS